MDWKQSKYPNYKVSDTGEVMSYRNQVNLIQRPDSGGYMRVSLFYEGKNFNALVHRLVAIAFIPNPENKPQVNHKDGDKSNNCVDNLEWVTNNENQAHRAENGLVFRKRVVQYDLEGNYIKTYDSLTEAALTNNLRKGNLSNVCLGRKKTLGGYIWRYEDVNGNAE
jgi:hypothetical protein